MIARVAILFLIVTSAAFCFGGGSLRLPDSPRGALLVTAFAPLLYPIVGYSFITMNCYCYLVLSYNITHLCKAHQCRTFDLCGKPLSRYMLASKMTPNSGNLEVFVDLNFHSPSYQFANEFSSVANLSTIKVDVSYAIQADVALKLAYSHNCYQFEIGYEFWGRSCEKICPRSCESFCKTKCCPTTEHEFWALKGDSFVYAFDPLIRQRNPGAVALSSSEQDAQIFCGTNNYFRTDNFPFKSNAGVDNALVAVRHSPAPLALFNYVNGQQDLPTDIYTSFNPYIFDTADTKQWDLDNAQSRGMSHKLFGDIGYTWNARKDNRFCIDWTPYLGVGGEVEFGKINKKSCVEHNITCVTKSPLSSDGQMRSRSCCCTNSSNACNNTSRCCKPQKCCCLNAAISQWGVWIKGGVSFN